MRRVRGQFDRRRVHDHLPTRPADRRPLGVPSGTDMARPAADPPITTDTELQPFGPGAHRALYRRWRSQRFGEVLGQDPIVATLRRAVATDRLAHAYLFVGPRGTGKTSTARILAKAINCTNRGEDGEPCDACPACVSIREGRALDVIEIDAASHGLVEDARDLVMRALTAPSEPRRRVYIIDEVHMLSTHAFNALLKLIEEPPDHVVFILATTDTHKVLPTIISRTQRFDFRRLAADVIVTKLARISTAEGADAEPEALALIARLADGGMRDAESLLDQVLAYAGSRVTAAAVREAVGLADDATIAALLDAYELADAPGALDRIEELADAGRDMAQVAAQAEVEARARLLASAADPVRARRLAQVLRAVAEAAGIGAREGRARLMLELLAVEPNPAVVAADRSLPQPANGVRARKPAPTVVRVPSVPQPQTPEPAAAEVAAEPAAGPLAGSSAGRPELDAVRTRWAEVIERAAPAIKPLLRECRPVALAGARLTLAFPEERGFMREKTATRSPAIEQLLITIFGGTWAIDCVSGNVDLEPLTIAAAVAPDPQDPDAQALLDGVLKITGGELVDVPEVH
jgi:DNA polymerase-3 subunit gamma/tau